MPFAVAELAVGLAGHRVALLAGSQKTGPVAVLLPVEPLRRVERCADGEGVLQPARAVDQGAAEGPGLRSRLVLVPLVEVIGAGPEGDLGVAQERRELSDCPREPWKPADHPPVFLEGFLERASQLLHGVGRGLLPSADLLCPCGSARDKGSEGDPDEQREGHPRRGHEGDGGVCNMDIEYAAGHGIRRVPPRVFPARSEASRGLGPHFSPPLTAGTRRCAGSCRSRYG